MSFPHMIPYAAPQYFFYLAIALCPLIIAGLLGKRLRWYEAIVTVLFLYISFGGEDWRQGVALIGYVIWQVLLTAGYAYYRNKNNQSFVFNLAVVLAILPLALSKILPIINGFSMFGFLGISYLTFKSVQMVMELRDGTIKQVSLGTYIQFLLFFPTISSGPIDRYRRFQQDLQRTLTTEQYTALLDLGIQRIFQGFLYKYILGYYFGQCLLPLLAKQALDSGGLSWWLIGYMYCYSFYLFFDFAGYSLFAVGVSNIMGYETPMNFNKPFLAWNIKEFWNRWHMSLSFWFRDYVYMRLMFTLIKKKLFKSRVVASNVGYFVLFLLMGVWHGLTWYYIAYGLYHAVLICLNDAWIRYKKQRQPKLPSNRWTHAFSVAATFHAVCVSLLIFSGFLNQLSFG